MTDPHRSDRLTEL